MASKTSSSLITREVERSLYRHRKRLLLELANLRDDSIERFRKLNASRFPYEDDGFLLNCRDRLRHAWSAPQEEKQDFVDDLVHHSAIKYGIAGFIAPITAGRLTAAPQHFLSQLAVAILENWPSFAICGNPECGASHFLAKRKTQKYCERGPCTDYAQRQYARSWWNKEGQKRRSRKTS
jgi:hypothetical protein